MSENRHQEHYEKFCASGQEPVRLAIALEEFFAPEGVEDGWRDAYGVYLKRRIRPAFEALIDADDCEKTALLFRQGWVDETQMDAFIARAAERNKTMALMELMHLKKEYFGFREEEFLF